MADTPDTPDAPTADEAKPAPRRRANPRKTVAPTTTKPRATPARGRGQKGVVAQAEDAVSRVAAATKDAVTSTADKAVKAVKPRSSSRAAPRATPSARTTGAKRPATTAKRAPGKKSAGRKSSLDKATDKLGGRWGAVSIVGGIAAAGAAAAALLTLRGSSKPKPAEPARTAHQPDGTDSSRSFQAGIADENTIPDTI